MAKSLPFILLLLCSGGCAALSESPDHAPPSRLQIAHVVSESAFLSGFPVDPYRVITHRQSAEPFGVVVVDGFPMRVAPTTGSDHDRSSRRDQAWCVVFGRGFRAHPNQIDPKQDLRVGDSILVGGHFVPDNLEPTEYSDVPSTVIVGRLAALASAHPADAPTYWVLVPAGDYRGFLGGPVASHTFAEGISVWGVVTHVSPLPAGPWSVGNILAVTSLPPDFGSE
jgi:hypothetical protein